MELLNQEEFEKYVQRNYEILIILSEPDISTEIAGECDVCKKHAFLKVHSRSFEMGSSNQGWFPRFTTFCAECPNCRRRSFIQTVRLVRQKVIGKLQSGKDNIEIEYEFYKLYRLPTIEESYANQDIPETYSSLKDTVSEASFCLTYGKYISAAILFRRGLQIIAKDILGAKGKTLFNQLEWLKTNQNSLKIDLTNIFHENTDIIKDIGNQGAHPDDDVTLHAFTKKDAEGLHDLFISIIYDLFVKPAKMKALQDELKQSRKLK